MKHEGHKTIKLSMRIGLAAVSALLAAQATTGKASASAQNVTITSITRTSLITIQVRGTATFEGGVTAAHVYGSLTQIQRRAELNSYDDYPFGEVPGDASANPRGAYTYDWTMSFYNPYGWKPGPAMLTVTTQSYDPILGGTIEQTKSGKVILPR